MPAPDCAAVFDKPTILRIYLPNAGRLMGRRLLIGSEDLGWIAGRVSRSEEHRVAALAVAQGDAAPHRPTSCLTTRMRQICHLSASIFELERPLSAHTNDGLS